MHFIAILEIPNNINNNSRINWIKDKKASVLPAKSRFVYGAHLTTEVDKVPYKSKVTINKINRVKEKIYYRRKRKNTGRRELKEDPHKQ